VAGESLRLGWQAVAKGFRGMYDHLGTTMVLSSAWFLLGFFPAGLTFLVLLQAPALNSLLIFGVVWAALFGPMTAAVYSAAMDLLEGGFFRLRDTFGHFRKHYKRAAGLSAVMGAILAVLVVDVLFFARVTAGWTQLIVIGIWGYFILMWAMTAIYVFPFAVRRDVSIWRILKMSVLMALDNAVATFVVGFFTLASLAVCVFLRAPVMLFMIGIFAFLHCAAFSELIKKYRRSAEGAEEQEKESVSND